MTVVPAALLPTSPVPDGVATLDRLHAELRARVDDHLRTTGHPRRGGARLHGTAALMVLWLAASYVVLVFAASTWWQVGLAAASLALAMAGVGFNVQHDANHGALSARAGVNRLGGMTLDLVGGSSYYWRHQHNVLHHGATNVAGVDHDLDTGGVARLAPDQPWRPIHRYQHLYLWVLYGFVPLKWQFADDFSQLRRGRIGSHPVARPRGADLAEFVAGKAAWLAVALVVPLLLHPWTVVVPVYIATMFLLGVMIATVFSVAHSNLEADHPAHVVRGRGWARSQIETTVDFRTNRILGAYLGGLDHQIEHHLFPRVAHTHYPAIAPIVEEVARRHGVAYHVHPSFRAAVAAHARFLRAMGRRPT